jgi:hypothetical protein
MLSDFMFCSKRHPVGKAYVAPLTGSNCFCCSFCCWGRVAAPNVQPVQAEPHWQYQKRQMQQQSRPHGSSPNSTPPFKPFQPAADGPCLMLAANAAAAPPAADVMAPGMLPCFTGACATAHAEQFGSIQDSMSLKHRKSTVYTT